MSAWAGRAALRTIPIVALENALIVAAVAGGVWVRLGEAGWIAFTVENGYAKTWFVAAVCQLCLYYADLYNTRSYTDHRELFIHLVQGLGTASLVLALLYFWFPSLIIGRGVFLISSVLTIGLLAVWRLLWEWFARRVAPTERLLLVGTTAPAVALARELFERRHELGVTLVGFVDPDPAKVGQPMINPGIIGTLEDIPSIVRARAVDRVVVSLADGRGALPMNKLLEMKINRGVTFDHLASVYERYTGKIAVENLRPSWLIFSEGFRKTFLLRAVKRVIDVGAALAGFALTAPILLIAALAVKWTSRGPVFYHQRRVGLHGRLFTAHKIRTMQADAEAETGAVWAKSNDTRITQVGRFLRRTRIDEIPQLWNVLIGEMSLVGPRPERPEFVAELTEKIPFYGLRHSVRPGVTGWAQVRYTYGASVEDALEKLQYDLFYIKHLTIPFDLFIVVSTIKTVMLQRGAR